MKEKINLGIYPPDIRETRTAVFSYMTAAGQIAEGWRVQLKIEPLTQASFARRDPPFTPPLGVE